VAGPRLLITRRSERLCGFLSGTGIPAPRPQTESIAEFRRSPMPALLYVIIGLSHSSWDKSNRETKREGEARWASELMLQ
jgi:hypothetical protein